MPDYFGHDRTAVHVLRHQVQQDPNRVWLLEGERRLTVREMDARSDVVARGLAAVGVVAGSPVLVMLPNGIEFIECWLALAKLHAIQVPVNTAYFGQMLLHIVRDSSAKHIVIHADYAPALTALAAELGPEPEVIIEVAAGKEGGGAPGRRRRSWEAMVREGEQSQQPLPAPPAHFDIAAIMYTSGTTGASKGVMVTHAHSYQYAAGDNSLQLRSEDVYYAPLPLFHIAGQWAVIYSCLIRGAAAVIKRKFSITDFWGDVERYGVTTSFMLGAMGSMLYRTTEGTRHTSLKKVLMSPLIPEYREFCARFGVRVATSYASTEINGVIATDLNPPNHSTCGRVRADKFEVKLVDEHDEEVPVGQVGELVVRPKLPWIVMAGYWRRPADTVAAWRNLWLHSGDLLRSDPSGYYYFVDRLKDCIRRRGENISSVEVETAINAIPEVLESAVIPVASELTEQEVLACVAFRPGVTLELAELHARIASALPRFMVPRYLRVIDAVPKTPTGKPQKYKLREEVDLAALWDAARG